ncbi:MAG: GntR family transcriptional regulator, partial [Bacillota bacterium]
MINSEAPVSMYYQLKMILAENIKNGTWAPNTKIMSEYEICDMYKVSRVTVRKAIDELVREGYLKRIQGKGTYVKEKSIVQTLNHFYSFREELKNNGIESVSKMLDFAVVELEEEIAQRLKRPIGTRAFRIERLFSADDKVYAREISYIPCALCELLTREQVEKNGLYKSLNTFNIFPSRASERLKAVSLSKKEAELMGLNPKDACIYLTRETFCGD